MQIKATLKLLPSLLESRLADVLYVETGARQNDHESMSPVSSVKLEETTSNKLFEVLV